MTGIEDLGIESMEIVETEGARDLEIRYQEGEGPLEWSRDTDLQIMRALGLAPQSWRLGSGLLLRASDGRLTEVVEIIRREVE